jgi:hypothetical protein
VFGRWIHEHRLVETRIRVHDRLVLRGGVGEHHVNALHLIDTSQARSAQPPNQGSLHGHALGVRGKQGGLLLLRKCWQQRLNVCVGLAINDDGGGISSRRCSIATASALG